MATRDPFVIVQGRGPLARWGSCGLCNHEFTGALEIELHRRHWRQHRDAPGSLGVCAALTDLASSLVRLEEFDVAERYFDEALHGVADDDQTHRRIILWSNLARATALNLAGRPRDALEILTRIGPRIEMFEDARIHADYMNKMTVTLANLHRIEEARPVAAEAVELARSCYGAQSLEALEAFGHTGSDSRRERSG